MYFIETTKMLWRVGMAAWLKKRTSMRIYFGVESSSVEIQMKRPSLL